MTLDELAKSRDSNVIIDPNPSKTDALPSDNVISEKNNKYYV